MRFKTAFVAAALTIAAASSAGAGSASQTGQVNLGPRLKQTAAMVDLEECQYPYLVACYKQTGDYVACYEYAETVAC